MPILTVELPPHESLTRQNLERWREVVSNPRLAALAERVETDRFGRIIMSPPPSAHHGSFQFQIGVLLKSQMREGRVITECPISTADGVKVADVAWASPGKLAELGERPCFAHAPEICVEVISPGNTPAELREKTALYFDAGALEVWHCSNDGSVQFFGPGGRVSKVCPGFPAQVAL